MCNLVSFELQHRESLNRKFTKSWQSISPKRALLCDISKDLQDREHLDPRFDYNRDRVRLPSLGKARYKGKM